MDTVRYIEARRCRCAQGLSVSAALALRKWHTLEESAKFLTDRTGKRIIVAEIVRLAIEQQLEMSLNLPSPVRARLVSDNQKDTSKSENLHGIWELPASGEALFALEALHASLRGWVSADRDVRNGVTVRRDGQSWELQPHKTGSSYSTRVVSPVPYGAQFVVAMPELKKLVEAIRANAPRQEDDRPLETRERETLLTILAALAVHAGLDKNASAIEGLTEDVGKRISERTIQNH